MNDTNGNGHQKAFNIERIKSPEELAAEASRKIAPQVRGAVNFSRLPMAAKGFFGALVDLSFLHCYGGSGRGKIFISVRDLARLLKHDKDSITAWRDVLVTARVLWVREGWPKSEWRICALCPPPETDFRVNEYQMLMGKAAANEGQGKPSDSHFFAPNGGSPTETEESPQSVGKTSDALSDTSGHDRGNLPTQPATVSPLSVGNLPTREGNSSARTGEGLGKDCPTPSDTRGETFRANKETPKEKGSPGEPECVPPVAPRVGTHTPLPRFQPLDGKMFARIRRKHGPDMIDRLKEKIYALENSRKPLANQKDIIAAYRGRIREVKNWMDGIEEAQPATK